MVQKRSSLWLLLLGVVGWGMFLMVIFWTSPQDWVAWGLFFASLFLATTVSGAWFAYSRFPADGVRLLLHSGLLGLLVIALAWLQAHRFLDWPLAVVAAAVFVLGELAVALPRRV